MTTPTTPTSQVVSLYLENELDAASRRLQSGLVSMDGGNNCDNHARDFVESYKAELYRIGDALTAVSHEIESNSRALLLRTSTLQTEENEPCSSATIAVLKTQVQALTNRSLNLYSQTQVDADELLRIATMADLKLGDFGIDVGLCAMTERQFQDYYPWKMLDYCGPGIIVIILSDVHTVIRNLEMKLSNKGSGYDKEKQWVAPTSFERITTKYWVDETNLYQVLLNSVSELPLLVYGQKGGRILDQKDIRRRNSIDSMENNFSCDSLWTSSVTTAITSIYFDSARMSMYSERIKRVEGAQLFRIRWYGPNKPREDQKVFLELKTHHEYWIDNLSVKERVAIKEADVCKLLDVNDDSWDEQTAMKIVERANPKEETNTIDDLTKLLLKIRALVVKFNLTPCVRTKYTRAAFQSSTSNRFRFTVDKDVTVINEAAYGHHRSSSSWCLKDSDAIAKKDIVKLPYCVYEVKVASEDNVKPAFVTELEENKAIVKAKKFSKFLTGATIFNAHKVKTLPWWTSEAAFTPLYEKSDETITATSIENAIDDESSEESFGIKNRWRRSSLEILRLHGLLKRVSMSYKQTKDSVLGKKKNRIAPKTRLRVEPKSHFANERTFIQWISAALLFITFSQLLFILASQSTNPAEANVAAIWMLAMSLFISCYALFTYYRRIYLMQNGKHYGYADFVGPAIMAFSIISGIVLLITYTYKSQAAIEEVFTMIHTPNSCVKRSLEGDSGISQIALAMELQPSGVIVDESKGLILVPTNNRIISLKDGLPSEEQNSESVKVVATIESTDIEALQHVGDYIFALSEAGKGAEVIALKWEGNSFEDTKLQEVHRWKLSESAPEGIALIPGMTSTSGEILVAQTSINVFDLSSFTFDAELITEKSLISNRLIAKGLSDPKVGSMQFFEGLLWILFDNSKVIRSFNLKTGSMVQEIQLPIAEIGSESQWEGMQLQRIAENDQTRRGLRGEQTTLVLHLALDTPAQIWSLRLRENGTNGQWSLPTCSGVSVN